MTSLSSSSPESFVADEERPGALDEALSLLGDVAYLRGSEINLNILLSSASRTDMSGFGTWPKTNGEGSGVESCGVSWSRENGGGGRRDSAEVVGAGVDDAWVFAFVVAFVVALEVANVEVVG